MLRREYSELETKGIVLAWYWGMSYRKLMTSQVVYHVMPFNILIRWLRDLLFWIRTAGERGYRQRIERHIFHDAFQNGQANIRSRIFLRVSDNLVTQGMPRENADELTEHILKAHLGI